MSCQFIQQPTPIPLRIVQLRLQLVQFLVIFVPSSSNLKPPSKQSQSSFRRTFSSFLVKTVPLDLGSEFLELVLDAEGVGSIGRQKLLALPQ